MRFQPSACAEFPNDNPDLHLGAVWVCNWTRSRPTAEEPDVERSDATPKTPAAPSGSVFEPVTAPVRALLAPGRTDEDCPPSETREAVAAASAATEPVGAAATDPAGEAGTQPVAAVRTEQRVVATRARPAEPESAPYIAFAEPSPWASDTLPIIEFAEPSSLDGASAEAPSAQGVGVPCAVAQAEQRLEELFGNTQTEHLLDLAPVDERAEKCASSANTSLDDDIMAWESQLSVQERAHASIELESPATAVNVENQCGTQLAAAPEAALKALSAAPWTDLLEETGAVDPAERTAGGAEPRRAEPANEAETPDASTDMNVVAELEPLVPLTLDASLLGEPELLAEACKLRAPKAEPKHTLDPLELDLRLPQEDSAWQQVEASLCSYLLEHEATRAAALLPAMLEGKRVRLDRLAQTVQQCLLADGIAAEREEGVVTSADFRRRAQRMRRAFTDGRLDAPTLTHWLVEVTNSLLASATSPESLLDNWRQCGLIDVIERAA